jgi:hypothetical protein
MISTEKLFILVFVLVMIATCFLFIYRYQLRVKKHMAEADHLYAMVKEIHAKLK